MMCSHRSVLLDACIDGLSISPGGVYIDGTFGRGGHSREILAKLGLTGCLIAIDKDPEAVSFAKDNFKEQSSFKMVHGSFGDITEIVKELDLLGKVDGILLDLGVSSPQLDKAERGFSFMKAGPLDMRMDNSKGLSASDWLMTAEIKDMTRIFKQYGEERFAKRIATAIASYRETQLIETTGQLVDIIDAAKPVREKHKHNATKVFQAIRIFINEELADLERFLEDCLDVLAVGGRLVVISFHSLEDRLVKRYMKKMSMGQQPPPGVPVLDSEIESTKRIKLISKAIKASELEVKENIRARSAVLRIGEKLR